MRGVASVWRLKRPDATTLKVRAKEMSEQAFDDVQFVSDDLLDAWRIVRTLGAGRAHYEHWTEDDRERFSWVPQTGRAPDDAQRVLELADSLTEDHVLFLCQGFATMRTVWHADRLEQALMEQQNIAREIERRRQRVLELVAKETALDLPPGQVKEAAIELARTWRGDSDGLLIAAEAVLLEPEETS